MAAPSAGEVGSRRDSWPKFLQFLCGLTTLNVSELARALTGFTVFSAPPAFFLGVLVAFRRGFYQLRFPRLFTVLALLFLVDGLAGTFANGFDVFTVRQLVAYVSSAFICLVMYCEGRRFGFGSITAATWMICVYLGLYLLFHLETALGVTRGLYFFIVQFITANPNEAYRDYLLRGIPRFFYLQPEPRVAALAIFAVIVPFLLSAFRRRRTRTNLVLVGLSLLVAALTNSFSATGYILLAIAFVFSERLAMLSSLAFTGFIAVGVPLILGSLVLTGNLELVFQDLLGSPSFGMANAGTLTTTAATIYVAGLAFLQNPFFGLGIGGYGQYFYAVVPKTGIAMSAEIVQKLTNEGLSSDYVPSAPTFVMKILSEMGLVGSALVVFAMYKLYVFAYKAAEPSVERTALRFIIVAIILSWQAYTSFLNPLYWVAAGLIGSMQRRHAVGAEGSGTEDSVVGEVPVSPSASP